jgi:ATP-dependent DNA helicase DinG
VNRTLDQLGLDDVFGEGGLFARELSGHEPRPEQRAMAELVAHGLAHGGVSLVEAGTGTGKTFAYLVPALLSDRRVVISTGTRALQDQIALRDVPTLARILGEPELPVAVLKGLSNYVCLRRYHELRESAESVRRAELARHLPVLEAFVQRAQRAGTSHATRGEASELPEVPEDAALWSLVLSGADTRVGTRCRFHDQCFVTRARAEAEAAQIVVVNHHLFFADLALRSRGASVIPPYDAVIFDEAHQLGDVMTEHFGLVVSAGRVDRLVRDADRTMSALRVESELSERLLRVVLLRTSDLVEALGKLRGRVSSEGRRALGSEDREALSDRLYDLEAALEAIGAHVRGTIDDEVRGHEALAALARRFDDLRNDLLVVIEGGHGLVVWIEHPRGRGARGGSVLGASPVDVARAFREEVLERTRTVVLTSATLSSALGPSKEERKSQPALVELELRIVRDEPEPAPPHEDAQDDARARASDSPFAFVRRELGIEGEVDELVLPSPFDYQSQAALYLPALPDPRDPAFSAAAREEVEALALASGGGAFVLTTSVRVLDDLSRHLAPGFRRRGLEVLVQGELPKHDLLERFRAHGHAVLFATLGFWEGVDVPGHALRLVVLDRVPFDVPTDPLVRARCERIEEDGGSAFKEHLLPSAALTLRQGFGRLVRTRSDRGLVAILDARLRSKGYGKLLLRALPDARRLEARDEALAFLHAVRSGGLQG